MKSSTLLSALMLALAANAATAQTAPGSSANPDYSYRIDRDAAGAYLVTLTSFHGPFHYRDMALTPQGCGASPGSPITSAAELWLFPQPTGVLSAEFRVPASSGGSCRFSTTFDLKAEDRPQHEEPDPESPPQGQKLQLWEMPDSPTDLSAADPVQIGPTPTQWGSTAVVPAAQADARRNGLCYFAYSYLSTNAGPGHAEGTSNALTLSAPGGPLLALDDLPAQLPMSATVVDGRIGLPSGISVVVVEVDAPAYVPETSETNNVRRVVVDVQGSCN
ncbi:MAG TPA: hypothetical protein VLF18_11460 [Tahibacter sp.]|uniref:hypothetical protein n=1 Tax=Tahibacter sp. TaxID=2056211 RepID=UPI002CEF5B55|nr:hypothetical protein [Tahibacter sp.]HSX60807.1 hypothetical protein [Tahibacter sp.]